MPLPLILAGVAVAAGSYGAKKGYDGYQDKTEANEIVNKAKSKYESAEKQFEAANKLTESSLTRLGQLQLDIGRDFDGFKSLAEELLEKLNQSAEKKASISIPAAQLDKIERLTLSTTAYLGKIAGGGAAGAAAAYAVYGGVMAVAAASTGTPIAALSGAAAYNATMAAIGGGSLAAGGFGMAGGAMVLGGVVAAPVLAIAGWAFASHAEEALSDAKRTRQEVDEAVEKMAKARAQLARTERYVNKIFSETLRIYQVFQSYYEDLKAIHQLLKSGTDPRFFQDEIILKVQNGMMLASILTDIITTPLFKPKTNRQGEVIVNKDNIVEIEIDSSGLQVLNTEAIDSTLQTSSEKAENFS